jgi:hypothetical protein
MSSYQVTIEELRKGVPPLRLISVTATDWLTAVDQAVAELSHEDAYFEEEEEKRSNEPNDELFS